MPYDLVFEGGGAKGLVFVGAMQAFTDAGHTFHRLVGTSAGAITAALLAAGFTPDELLAATSEKLADGRARFASFMDIPASFDEEAIDRSLYTAVLAGADIPFIPERLEKRADRIFLNGLLQVPVFRNIFSFVEKGGWFAGEAFLAWLTEKLDGNGRFLGHTTLAQFHEQRPDNELTVIAADTTGGIRLILNHRTAPDLPVIWAVRMSMSIPFLWQEVEWQPDWGRYRAENITGHTIVDGGLLSNFPIDLPISKDAEIRKIMGTTGHQPKVLGLLIDENLPVPGAGEPPALMTDQPQLLPEMPGIDLKQIQTIQRITRLVDTLTNARDKFVIESHKDRVCRLPAQGYGTTEFDMSDRRIEALIAAGRKTMAAFLKGESDKTEKQQVKPITGGGSSAGE